MQGRINLRMKRIHKFFQAYVISSSHQNNTMAVYQGNGPPPTGVLAYNSHSERGWNDPPTLAFAATGQAASAPKKRLDLRKRVAHDFFSGNGLNAGMANMTVNQTPSNQMPYMNGTVTSAYTPPPQLPPASQMPPVSQQSPALQMPPVSHIPPTSQMPQVSHIPPASQMPPTVPMPGHAYGTGPSIQPYKYPPHGSHTLPGSMTPPVVPVAQPHSPHLFHAASMPNLQHKTTQDQTTPPFPKSPASLAQPIFNVNTPTTVAVSGAPIAQVSSHLSGIPHVGKPLFYLNSNQDKPALNIDVSTANASQVSSAGMASMTTIIPHDCRKNEQVMMNKTMPELTPEHFEHAHHVRSNSMPDFKPLIDSPPILSAPPTDGYYTQRSSSACSSRQRTPSPLAAKKEILSTTDQAPVTDNIEVRTTVIDQLNFSLEKCAPTIEVKIYEDIQKRINIFDTQWTEQNLKEPVRTRMVSLSQALTNKDFVEADRIHQSLIVDYSNEVSQWMVGIKKLIAVCKTIQLQNSQ